MPHAQPYGYSVGVFVITKAGLRSQIGQLRERIQLVVVIRLQVLPLAMKALALCQGLGSFGQDESPKSA